MSFGKIGFNKILGVFPTLERNERLDLVQQLEQSAQVECPGVGPQQHIEK